MKTIRINALNLIKQQLDQAHNDMVRTLKTIGWNHYNEVFHHYYRLGMKIKNRYSI
jgi:hypothetical protein